MQVDADELTEDELWEDVVHTLYPNAAKEEIEEELTNRFCKD